MSVNAFIPAAGDLPKHLDSIDHDAYGSSNASFLDPMEERKMIKHVGVVTMLIGTLLAQCVMGQAVNKAFWACRGGVGMINPNSVEYVALFEGSSNLGLQQSYQEQFCTYLKTNKVADELKERHHAYPQCGCQQLQDKAMSLGYMNNLNISYPTIPHTEVVWFPSHD